MTYSDSGSDMQIEDGLLPHPNSKTRERVFRDRTRLDVL